MADYVCQPAPVTVDPCPTGTAPAVTVSSTEQPVVYPALFDHLHTQDVLVFMAFALAFILGFGQGRR